MPFENGEYQTEYPAGVVPVKPESECAAEKLLEKAKCLLDRSSKILESQSPVNLGFEQKKVLFWKAASTIGEARALAHEAGGGGVGFKTRLEKMIDAVQAAVRDLPDNDPVKILCQWRLEKPLEPAVPELSAEEQREANKSSGKFIYEIAQKAGDVDYEAQLEQARNNFADGLEKSSPEHARAYWVAVDLAIKVRAAGGRALFVGGSVRDIRSSIIPKDFDIEVYGIDSNSIDEIIQGMGYEVDGVGAAFAVKKLHLGGGMDLDIALPRVDSQNSPEHNSTKSKAVIDLPIREACRRRDFTINSMAADVLTGELFDFFGGDTDLANGILRVTDERLFCDDPLRVMRGMQFVGRLGLAVDERTTEIMKMMVFELDRVACDRFKEEWSKLLLKSEMPSLGLLKGKEWGVFDELYPELGNLFKVKQSPTWHPEGNAGIHTLLTVDEAVKIVKREGLSGDTALAIMLAAVCHDFGKNIATKDDGEGKIVSPGHERAGIEPAEAFLERIGISLAMRKKILKLVEFHMAPAQLYAANVVSGCSVSDGAIRKLALGLGNAATIEELVLVAEADNAGRGFAGANEMIEKYLQIDGFAAGPWLLERARALNVAKEKPRPMLNGKMILDFGFKAGPAIGEIIKIADRLRDEKGFNRQNVLVEIYRSVLENDVIDPKKTIDRLSEMLNP